MRKHSWLFRFLAVFIIVGSSIVSIAGTYPKNNGKGIVYPTAVEYNVEYNGTTKINDIQKVDYDHGWAVGNDGLVLKKNGGWTAVDLGMPVTDPQTNYNFNAVHCLESNTQYGWIVGENKANNNGILVRTINGGTNWSVVSMLSLNLPVGTAFKGVSFANINDGYIACANGIVLKSNDGGASWPADQIKYPVNDPAKDPNGVSIHYQDVITRPTYPNQVWAIGDNTGVLAESYDGGNTWPSQTVNALPSAVATTYKWPDNTQFNVPLALGPTDFAADGEMLGTGWSWGATYNHGYYYNGTALTQIAPSTIWLNGADKAGSSNAISGSDGFTVYGDGVGNNVDMTSATVYPTPYVSSHRTYAGSDGMIYSTYYPTPVVDAWCYATGVDKQIKVEWSSMYPLGATSIEIYKCESLLGMPYPPCATVSGSATSWTDNWANYNMEYHYWIKPVNGSGTTWIYAGSCKPSSGDVPSPAPAAPTNVTATDISYDHGECVYLTWSGSTTFYHVGRRIAGTTEFYPIVTTDDTYYFDYSAKNGFTYEYAVISEQGNSFTPSAYSTIVSCKPIDDIAPAQLPIQTGYYDAASRTITLNWQPSTDDPNFGGYWLCPEPLGDFASVMFASSDPGGYEPDAYHVEHAAPLQRTTYKYYVPDEYLGQSLGFSITAMDRSGNIAPWSPTFAINTKAFTNSNVANATAYNNGRHLIYDNNGKLHLTYTSVDSVFYQNSIDDGYTWSGTWASGPGLEAGGTNPSSVIGIYGNDTIISWKAETPLTGWVLKTAKHAGNVWQNVETILEQSGGYDQLYLVSPPSMVVNAAGTHLVLEKIDSHYSGSGYIWYWKLLYGFRPAGGTAFSWNTLDSTSGSGGDPQENPASPSICVDTKGGIHVAWDYEGEVYWKVYDPYLAAWKNKVNLSNSPEVVSAEPSISFYGDVHIVWQEGNDIYHNKGNWGLPLALKSKAVSLPFSWQGAENVNPNSSGTASLNPVFDGNYIAWSEESATTPGQFMASYANYADFVWQVEPDYSKNPTQPSVYPQIAYRQNADGNKMTTIWTEGTGPLYSLIARDTAGQVTAQLAADVGGTETSIYTIERDGYLVYTQAKSSVITVDYDSTELLYYLPTLDREQKQTLKINLYQEYTDKAVYIYQIWVDNVSLGVVKVPSGKLVTFEKDLPNAVSHDGEGILKIVNLKKGAIVTCDRYELFAYDKATGKKNSNGGTQSDMGEAKPVAYRYELMQNAPNPCSKQTMINYQLAKQGQVSLKVYNTLGQVVKTLVNESQNPGSYSVKWNGNDEAGRQAAAGIYFYRLASGEFNSTKKMVVLR